MNYELHLKLNESYKTLILIVYWLFQHSQFLYVSITINIYLNVC